MRFRTGIVSLAALSALGATVLGQRGSLPAPTLPPQTISLPTFTHTAAVEGASFTYTLLGGDPARGGTTTIPTVLVPIVLTIEAPMDAAGKKAVLDAGPLAPQVIRSPIFARYAFPSGTTQYADALMRTDFHSVAREDWHTLLGQPTVVPVRVDVPVGMGYVLTSKRTGRMLAMVDVRFVQQKLFEALRSDAVAPGTLVLAVVRDTTYYVNGDATQCCQWGAYGVDTSAGTRQPFVLGTYLDPQVADVDADVQPITQELARFFRDPLHDPLYRGARGAPAPGNVFPAWMKVPATTPTEQPRQNSAAGGSGIASGGSDPTDRNWKNTLPASKAFAATVGGVAYHLQNVALLHWYNRAPSPTSWGGAYSFPDASALPEPARPAPARRGGGGGPFGAATAAAENGVRPVAVTSGPNGHKLIGYWAGYGSIRDVSPQWDVILVAFATPDHAAGEGQMRYRVNGSLTPEQFKADIKFKQGQGKKVMVSLGGGGQSFTLETEDAKQRFIRSVEEICAEFGFDGIDIDFETPSLEVNPGDADFKHPTTPSIVNLIAALREIHDHFGPGFLVSLVPEGSQTPAGYPGYGGQFGSYIPILEGIRDILAFTDTQDYNCPPIEGLDGEYYMPGTVEYHAAATELFLQGFDVGRDPRHHFDALPPDKVIIGYLNSDTTPEIVRESMRMLITGKSNLPTRYRLRRPGGYPTFAGAMFWTIDADRREEYRYSNVVGPLLHGFTAK